MTGYWLAVTHIVATAIGFNEISHFFFYYDLTQTGENIKVNHGYHCGIQVVKDPNNPGGMGDTVTTPKAGPSLLSRQDEGVAYGSNPARTGTMGVSGNSCKFHFDKYYTVRGATLAYYMNPNNSMTNLGTNTDNSATEAMGCGANFSNCTTPGWEDWDGDGNPGITLAVAGTATGQIFAAQRDFSEFNGTVPMNANKFEVGIVDSGGHPSCGPEQYALSYGGGCNAICNTGATLASCPSSGCAAEFFVDWVRLDSPPGADPTAICAYVANNAATMVPRAMSANSVP
jgi:hypothetical protein